MIAKDHGSVPDQGYPMITEVNTIYFVIDGLEFFLGGGEEKYVAPSKIKICNATCTHHNGNIINLYRGP